MKNTKQLLASVLISVLTLQPALAAVSEYRIPLRHKVTPGATQPDTEPGTGDGDVEVGDGPDAPVLTFTPSSLAFNVTRIDDTLRTSLLTNEGKTAATLKGFVSNSTFSIHHSCPAKLAPGASCLVSAKRADDAPPKANYSMRVMAQGTAKVAVLGLTTEAQNIPDGTPYLTLDRDLVDLGEVAPGVATAGSAILTNIGTGAANLRGIGSSGPFTVTSNCPDNLAPEASCSISATFASTQNDTHKFGMRIGVAKGDAGIPLTFFAKVIGGVEPKPALRFDTDAVPFGTVAVGASVAKTFKLHNVGAGPAALSPLKSTDDFTVTSNCPANLPESGQCSVTATFNGRVPRTAPSYVLKAIAPEAEAEVLLTGGVDGDAQEVHGPNLTFDPGHVSFGTVLVGQQVAQQVVLSNTGDEIATIKRLGIVGGDGEFRQTNDCPSTLAPGASCTVKLGHTPAALDLRVGYLRALLDNDLETTITLTSFGIQAVLGAPSAVQYGGILMAAKLPAKPVGLGNGGNIPLTGLSVVNTDKRLTVDRGNCTDTLPAKQNCALLVSYSPASDGPFETSFQVKSDNGGSATISVTGTPFRLSMSPSTLTYPDTVVGTSAPDQYATLTNEGQVPVSLGISMDYGVESFNQSNGCGTSLAGGASCIITARFTPNEEKPRAGGVSVAVAESLAAYLALEGTGIVHRLTLSNSAMPFPQTLVGETASPLSVIVSNMSGVTASITGISFVENKAGFTQTNNCELPLAPGSSCTITAQWTAPAKGDSGAVVAIRSSLGTYTLNLSGFGIVHEDEDDEKDDEEEEEEEEQIPPPPPVVIEFPDTQVGLSSDVRNITFTNKGKGPLAVQGISVDAGRTDFAQSNNCGKTLAAEESCIISMRFTPSTSGLRTGHIILASETQLYQFELSGVGIGAIVELYPEGDPNFGEVLVGKTVQRAFTFRNSGTVAARKVSATVDGTYVALISNTCGTADAPKVVGVDEACTMVVEYAPKSAGDHTNNRLTVSSDAANGPQSVGIAGKAIQAIGRLVADASTDFGTVSTGSTTTLKFTFVNTGDASATGVYALLDGKDMQLSTNNCGTEEKPISLGIEKICTMTVSFTPSSVGIKEGSLEIRSSATNGVQTLKLTGGGKYSTNGYRLQFNGAPGSTFIEDTGTGSPWSSFNGAAVTTSVYREGTGALQFNGINQAVSGPKIAYTGDFAVSGWIRMTARPASGTTIVGQWDQSNGASTGGWALSVDSIGRLAVTWAPASTMSAFLFSNATVPLNKWTHVALAHSGSSFKVYMNGVVVASGVSAGQLSALDVPTSIGSYFNFNRVLGAGNFFSGQMDDIRIVTGSAVIDFPSSNGKLVMSDADFGVVAIGERTTKVLTVSNNGTDAVEVSEVTADGDFLITDSSACTSGVLAPGGSCKVSVSFQPSSASARQGTLTVTSDAQTRVMTVSLSGSGTPNTLLKVRAESANLADEAGGGLTANGEVSVTSSNPVDGAGSILFTGQNAYLMTQNSPKYSFGAGEFTMEAWVRPTQGGSSVVLSNFTNSTWQPNRWALTTQHPLTGGYAAFFIYNYNAQAAPVVMSKTPIPLNSWTHLAVTRSGATFRMYVNGVLESTGTFAGMIDGGASTSNAIGIGRFESGLNGYIYSGQMDDVRIIAGQAVYPGNFTPPTNMR